MPKTQPPCGLPDRQTEDARHMRLCAASRPIFRTGKKTTGQFAGLLASLFGMVAGSLLPQWIRPVHGHVPVFEGSDA